MAARATPIVGAALRRLEIGAALRHLGLAALLAFVVTQLSQPRPLERRLAEYTHRHAFSIVAWEATALGAAAWRVVSPPTLPDEPRARATLVREYMAIMEEVDRARRGRDREFELPMGRRDQGALERFERDVRSAEARAAELRPAVEVAIADQVEHSLAELGLRPALFELGADDGWPLPFVRIYPDVFFRFEGLPINLVVAPRNRVAIVGSVLLRPDLPLAEVERLEEKIDRRDVASLAMRIGGFASYPSMIPDTDPIERHLNVIAHEWSHHYLAFRPLGRAYFSDYAMRSINEIVADMVGQEVGEHAFSAHFRGVEPPRRAAASAPAAAPAPRPAADFGAEMRRIRRTVEGMLGSGDIAGAERYMQEQRDFLNDLGFRVRRVNTAYLAFFGSYSGGANPYEEPLRQVRRRSGTLAEFVRVVQSIDSPEALFRLAAT